MAEEQLNNPIGSEFLVSSVILRQWIFLFTTEGRAA
jgi:hypothetical protein